MKKVLISVLSVLLTLCFFVSCSSVQEDGVSYYCEEKGFTVTFYEDGGGVYVTSKTVEYDSTSFGGEMITVGENEPTDYETLTLYNSTDYVTFYKSNHTPITSWDELISLDTIYGAVGWEFNKI